MHRKRDRGYRKDQVKILQEKEYRGATYFDMCEGKNWIRLETNTFFVQKTFKFYKKAEIFWQPK